MLEAIIKASPLAIIAVDAEERVILWNKSAERMFGWNEEEVLGQQTADSSSGTGSGGAGSRYHPRPGARIRDPYGFARMAPAFRSAYGARRLPAWADGSPCSADLTQAREAERTRADLIESERAARELAVVGQRFSLLLEAAPDAILEVDPEGRIVLANTEAERLFQRSREELVGLPVEALLPERFRGGHTAHRDHYGVSPSAPAHGRRAGSVRGPQGWHRIRGRHQS